MARSIITPAYLERIRTAGDLALAAVRLKDSQATYPPLPHLSTWELVCEECLDTQRDAPYYDRIVAELFRRGISPSELEAMRLFAWETAGWLNFEKMLWDWCSLDESDIRRAIEWQQSVGEIDHLEADRRLHFLALYTGGLHNPV